MGGDPFGLPAEPEEQGRGDEKNEENRPDAARQGKGAENPRTSGICSSLTSGFRACFL